MPVNKGKLIIFSAPSGSGKTTLVRHLMKQRHDLAFSISACSRKRRPGEVDGKDYYFISADDFREKITKKEFVEWEEVYPDHFYGTLSAEVERIRNSGYHVLFDVDVVGGVNIKRIFGAEALAVFVRPPSIDSLRERLLKRATDDEQAIQTRLEKAAYELGFEKYFDVTIINEDLDKAQREAQSVVAHFIDNKP